MPGKISRRVYADMFGPTTGDRVRLADTDLIIEVEKDFTDLRRRGEIRRRQGHSRRHGTVAGHQQGAVDTVITNALILDHWGIVKADVGLKDGRIAAIGKAAIPTSSPA